MFSAINYISSIFIWVVATLGHGDDIIGGCLHGATTPCPPDTVSKVCRDVTWGLCQPPLLPTDGPTD